MKEKEHFNPLPRKEGDRKNCFEVTDDGRISIHSLVKRETTSCADLHRASGDFNPLPRKEGDELTSGGYAIDVTISIHSLVKRETVCCHVFSPF